MPYTLAIRTFIQRSAACACPAHVYFLIMIVSVLITAAQKRAARDSEQADRQLAAQRKEEQARKTQIEEEQKREMKEAVDAVRS